jgi:hypothetical protein
MAFFVASHGNQHAARKHARMANIQERQAHREEARAMRDLARGDLGGFVHHEARASRFHDRAVRQDQMAADAAIFGRHHHRLHPHGRVVRVGMGGAFAAGAAMGAVAAGGYSSSQRVYGAPANAGLVYTSAPAVVVVGQQPPMHARRREQPRYQQMSVKCPAGAGAGSTIAIMANNQKMSVQVPAGVSAGMQFTINVPMPQAQTPPQVQAVPVQQQFTITCPAAAIPGQVITVNVNGQMRQVQVPQGVSAGMQFQFTV